MPLGRSFWEWVCLVADPGVSMDACARHPVYDELSVAVSAEPEPGFAIKARALFDPWDEALLFDACVVASRRLAPHQEMRMATDGQGDLAVRFNNMDAVFWGLRHLMGAVCEARASERSDAKLVTLDAAIRRIQGHLRVQELADSFQIRL